MIATRHSFHLSETAEMVAREVAEFFTARALSAISERGRFSVALAGGSTPRRVYEIVASGAAGAVEWPKVHVFFGDERCVPPDHADSNYRMARETLLARVPVPEENVHRMIGETDAAASARLYEDEMRSFFGADAAWPALDLVLLGLGEDGHTASLFPGTRALGEGRAWAAANWVERLDAFRLTLTVPVINRAHGVAFVVAGGGKARVLAEVCEGPRDPLRLPAQLVEPRSGPLHWFVDEAAAAELKGVGET